MENLDDIYRSESLETLDDIEAALLALEDAPGDSELIRRVFRGMHTIKGSGAMFGFTNISHFAHQIEMVFEQIRNGELAVSHELMDTTLLSCDLIRAMLADASQAEESLTARAGELTAEIKRILGGAPAVKSYRLRIRLLIDSGEWRPRPLLTRERLARLGEYSFLHLSEMTDKAPDYQSCDIVLRSAKELGEIQTEILSNLSPSASGPATMVGELFLAEEGGFTPGWWANQAPAGLVQVEDAIADQWLVTTALTGQAEVNGLQRECQAAPEPALFVVDKANLDRMVELVGNLARIQEEMSARLAATSDSQLQLQERELAQAVDELRRMTMRILWHLE